MRLRCVFLFVVLELWDLGRPCYGGGQCADFGPFFTVHVRQTPLKGRFSRAPFVKYIPAVDPATSSEPASTSETPAANGDATSTTTPPATNGEHKPREPRYPPQAHGWGLVGFDVPLKEEDVAFVKETIKELGGKEVTWSMAGGEYPFSSSLFSLVPVHLEIEV